MSTNKTGQKAANKQSVTIIKPLKGWVSINFRELWNHRELLYFLIWRDIKIRYKQTIFGFLWAVIQPLMMMLVFTLFFGKLAGVPSNGIPYPLFCYAALLPWTLFSEGLTRASNSVDASLIQKVYFPRIILPTASILSPLIDFIFAIIPLLGLMFFYGYMPNERMLLFLPLCVLVLMLSLGVGLWLAAINVEYRDIRYVIPFTVQLLMFASPIIYSSNFVPPRFQVAYGLLNPISGILEGFRWAITGTTPPSLQQLFASTGIILVILVSGAYFFQRRQGAFADYI